MFVTVYADVACVGVDKVFVDYLVKKEKSGALQYSCCRCRSGARACDVSSSQSGLVSAFGQFLKIGVLSKKVGKMVRKFENIIQGHVGTGVQLMSDNCSERL